MLSWAGGSRGDPVACDFFDPAPRLRDGPDRCRLPAAIAEFGHARSTACLGLPGLCFDRQARERELRRRERERRASEVPASVWCRLARRWR